MKLSECPDCSHGVSKSAQQCPQCGRPLRAKKTVFYYVFCGTLCLIATVLVLGFSFGLIGLFGTAAIEAVDEAASNPIQNEGRLAYVAAREFCRNGLKSPSTAKFITRNPASRSDVFTVAGRYSNTGKNHWHASGLVDSQNGFGAMLRSEWEAIVEHTPSGNWHLEWVKVGDEEGGTIPATKKVEREEREDTVVVPQAPSRAEQIKSARMAFEQERQQNRILSDSAAVNWQIKRASEGYASAQFDLGMRYLEGKGIEQDEERGKRLIKSSADQGYAFAIKKLKTLE